MKMMKIEILANFFILTPPTSPLAKYLRTRKQQKSTVNMPEDEKTTVFLRHKNSTYTVAPFNSLTPFSALARPKTTIKEIEKRVHVHPIFEMVPKFHRMLLLASKSQVTRNPLHLHPASFSKTTFNILVAV